MGLPHVDQCCCGCSLRFGAFVVGFIFTIACLAQTITLSILAEDMNDCYYYSTCWQYDTNRSVVIVQAVIAAIMLFTNILLVVGTLQNKAALIKPWLGIYSVLIIIEFIFGIIIVGFYFAEDVASGFYALLVYLCALSFICYCMIVVKSYHLKLVTPVSSRHPQFVGQVYVGGVTVQQPPPHGMPGQVPPYSPHMPQQGYPQVPGQAYPPAYQQQMPGQGYPQMQGQVYPQMPTDPQQSQPPKY